MKKVYLLLIILVLSTSLMSRWVEVNRENENNLYSCEQQTMGNAVVNFTLDGFEWDEYNYQGEQYLVIDHPNKGRLLEAGMPDLPVFTKALVIPDEGSSRLEVISYDKTIYEDVKIFPQEALSYEYEGIKDNFRINEEYYQQGGNYPAEPAWLGEPAIMRDLRVVPVTFSPFSYNAREKTLTVFSNIQVEIITEGEGGANTRTGERRLSRSFEPMYRANTLNYDQMGFRDEYQSPMVIFVCNDNDDVLENLEYLVEWKRQKGFEVVVATTSETGTTNTSIKNYIQNAYDNWENPPEYVNFMGDGTGQFVIPTWFSSGGWSGEGDHPYAQLEGDDILADIYLGRMTFSTINKLQAMIMKVLSYEKEPYMGNTEWYNRALITGDPSSSGYSCVAFGKAVKELMLDFEGNYWCDDNFVEVYTSPFANQMNTAVNLGVNFFAYRGFGGTSGWYSGSTNNGFMMPFLVMPTCNANDWYSGTGNVEGFYLMGSTSLPNGGIGAVGTATSGTHTPFNNAFAVGVWGGIFRDAIYSMGGAVMQGKYYLWLTFPQNPGGYVNMFSHWNTLMGDATVDLWTRLPQNMTAIYDQTIPAGSNYYQIAVADSIGNAAEGACVTLYGEDGDFLAKDYCNSSGAAILPLANAAEGEYTLTITKHDHIPVIDEIEIVQAEQYVDIYSFNINDSAGNGNGLINPGETIELEVFLENLGNMTVNDVNVSMQINNDQVTLLTDSVEYGNINTGEITAGSSAFEMEIADNVLGGEEFAFELTITDEDAHAWVTLIFIPVEGPNLYAGEYIIDGDGVIDPGETEEIYFVLENAGNMAADGITGELICNNRRITLIDSLGSFGTIAGGGNGSNAADRFSVTASMAILPGTHIPFMIHLTNSEGYDDYVTMNVAIGDPQQTDPYGPDAYGYWCYDDSDADYAKCPEYDWIEIDPGYDGEGNLISWVYQPAGGEGGGTGAYQNIDFPHDFSFVFYGEEYDQFCVSSNGWIAPGHHESGNFMNYQIPGPQGPSPMIAVFWDDLNTVPGGVYWYYDEDLHYYVVQWSRIQNGDTGAPETFQVILYDPIYYPTTTGDSEIKMQYMDVTNNNMGSYPSNHGQYCTVGLENHDSQIGLQYTFNNTYPQACKPLYDETALLFTPPPIPPDGPFLGVNDFYAYSGDDSFIEAGETSLISIELENMGAETANNVLVEMAVNDEYITLGDNTESYPALAAGDFITLANAFSIDVSANVPDYYIFYLEVIISCDEDSWNWMLPFTAYWENTFAVDQDSIYFELQPSQIGSHQFTLTNQGTLPVDFYIRTDETTQPDRDISDSFVTIDTDSFTPGEETSWTFSVYNGSQDNEWVSDVWLDFPLGVTVLSAANAIGGSGGPLVWDGTTGAGQLINWHGLTSNGWGVLHDGETAEWEVDVLLSTEFAGDMTLGWEVGGDGYGEEPHSLNGEITLLYPLRWINLDTSSGSLDAGQSQEIIVNFDSSEIDEGLHCGNIVITCDSWDTKIIPVTLNVFQVDDDNELIPESFKLIGNFPNPFNPETEILFRLPDNSQVSLKIYNIKGQMIRSFKITEANSGINSVIWDGNNQKGEPVSSGVYFYKLKSGGKEISRKMILLK